MVSKVYYTAEANQVLYANNGNQEQMQCTHQPSSLHFQCGTSGFGSFTVDISGNGGTTGATVTVNMVGKGACEAKCNANTQGGLWTCNPGLSGTCGYVIRGSEGGTWTCNVQIAAL